MIPWRKLKYDTSMPPKVQGVRIALVAPAGAKPKGKSSFQERAVMPIEGINQPDHIDIDGQLRLKAYDGSFDFAYSWYQDMESLKLIDGEEAIPYTMERLQEMYGYLNNHGELYFIEKKISENYIPVGDVTFWKDDMPIVIAKKFRNQGIGKKVVQCLIHRAKALGYKQIHIQQIYHYNTGSQKLFQGCGFKKTASTEIGASYSLDIK
jgi:RimJ/RimL family protein N-acetyltransferase